MKKALVLLVAILLLQAGAHAQTFDTIAYKKVYKENLNSFYFEEEFSPATKIAGLSKAWAEAKFNFANFDLVPRLKWDSLYHSYIPLVLETKSPVQYYKVLTKFYTQLHDGHSMIMPPKTLWDSLGSSLPIRTRLIEDEVVVTALNSSHKDFQILQPGTIIKKVNGVDVKDYAENVIAPFVSYSTPQDRIARTYSFFLTNGDINEPIILELKKLRGEVETHSFKRISRTQMFPQASGYSYKLIDADIRLLTINTFNEENLIPYLDSIFQKMPLPENLIIDIRNNGGGNSNNGFELLGYLTNKPFSFGVNVQREYKPTQRAWQIEPDRLHISEYDWKPYKSPTFKGKVVVLAGPDTYSAAEDFIVAFRSIGRGVVIGQSTGGSTGQPLFFPLPFGGMGAVCSKRDLMVDRTEFVGVGLKPDVWVDYKLQDVLSAKDEALVEALKYFDEKL